MSGETVEQVREPLMLRLRFKGEIKLWGWTLLPILWAKWRLRKASMERRDTPKLRERCIDYAIRGGAVGASVEWDAERIRDFIIKRRR